MVLVGEFPFFTPEALFAHFVEPDLLVQWWPKRAITDPRVGGTYQFEWPESNWLLSGEYQAIEPGRHLAFTWRWNHDLDQDVKLVVHLYFEATVEGTRMSIFHGPFVGEDARERDGVREGWIHFAMLLAGLRRAPDMKESA